MNDRAKAIVLGLTWTAVLIAYGVGSSAQRHASPARRGAPSLIRPINLHVAPAMLAPPRHRSLDV